MITKKQLDDMGNGVFIPSVPIIIETLHLAVSLIEELDNSYETPETRQAAKQFLELWYDRKNP